MQMFHRVCHGGSAGVVVPVPGGSPHVPSTSDAASSMPQLSCSSGNDQSECEAGRDSFMYEANNSEGNPADYLHLPIRQSFTLSSEPLYSNYSSENVASDGSLCPSHTGVCPRMQDSNMLQTNFIFTPSGVPGLDDSLEDCVPSDSALPGEVGTECVEGQSFFHEDLQSWMHPSSGGEQVATDGEHESTPGLTNFSRHFSSTRHSEAGVDFFNTAQPEVTLASHCGLPDIPNTVCSNWSIALPLVPDLSYANCQLPEMCIPASSPGMFGPEVSRAVVGVDSG